jgi:hypothetical protein
MAALHAPMNKPWEEVTEFVFANATTDPSAFL